MPREGIEQAKAKILSEVNSAQITEPQETPKATPPDTTSTTPPPNQGGRELTPETLEVVLELPFKAARGYTGYDGFRMDEKLKTVIIESGYTAAKDYGLAWLPKFLNLIVFIVTYGSNLINSLFGYFNKRKQQEKPKNEERTKEPERPEEPGSEFEPEEPAPVPERETEEPGDKPEPFRM